MYPHACYLSAPSPPTTPVIRVPPCPRPTHTLRQGAPLVPSSPPPTHPPDSPACRGDQQGGRQGGRGRQFHAAAASPVRSSIRSSIRRRHRHRRRRLRAHCDLIYVVLQPREVPVRCGRQVGHAQGVLHAHALLVVAGQQGQGGQQVVLEHLDLGGGDDLVGGGRGAGEGGSPCNHAITLDGTGREAQAGGQATQAVRPSSFSWHRLYAPPRSPGTGTTPYAPPHPPDEGTTPLLLLLTPLR